jgi:hypothetical protein
MTRLDYLLKANPTITNLVKQDLLSLPVSYTEQGWIGQYLSYVDSTTGQWGNGVYDPWWTSTFYTLRELTLLRINPDHPHFQKGIDVLLHHMWNPSTFEEDDLCVLAMFVVILLHGKRDLSIIDAMLNRILPFQLEDGGFNCDSVYKKVHHSSIHTTLSVLEALQSYQRVYGTNPRYHEAEQRGQAYLKRKSLLRKERDQSFILKDILTYAYPTRWYYDSLRVLVYFAHAKVFFDDSMKEAYMLMLKRLDKGLLPRGKTYSGKTLFPLLKQDVQAYQTYLALRVVLHVNPERFNHYLYQDID